MRRENYGAIPFTLLNGGKRFRSTNLRLLPLFPLGADEPRLLAPLFPAGAQEPRLLGLRPPLFPAGAQEPRLFELLPLQFPTGAQEPRLLQLFPVRKGIKANDRILGSHPVARTSEPGLPQRGDSTTNSLQASNEHVSVGQLAIQDPFAPESPSTTLAAVGGQAVNVRSPIEVDTVRNNTTNSTKRAPASQPRSSSTGEIGTSPPETNQFGSSLYGGRISKKRRPLADQEPNSTRVEHVGSRQLEKADLRNKSTQERREHVSQRLPLSNVPVKRRRLAFQEPSLSGQGSTRPGAKIVNTNPPVTRQGSTRGGRQNMQIVPLASREPTPLASREPTPEWGNPILMEMATFVGQQVQNTRSTARRNTRPRGRPADTRQSPGGEATSVSPLQNRRHPVIPRLEGGPRPKSSAYKGVTRYKRTKRWEANIWHDGKQTYMGAHATEIQAARAYDRALIHFRGQGVQLNFNLDDYRAELTQLSNIRSEDLVLILRKQSRGLGMPMPDYKYRRRRR